MNSMRMRLPGVDGDFQVNAEDTLAVHGSFQMRENL